VANTLEGFRLAPQQQHIWELQQQGEVYCASCIVKIEGDLQVERLKKALTILVDRHEILRTTFHRLPGRKAVIQTIHEELPSGWTWQNLKDQSQEQQNQIVDTLLSESAINVSEGPLLQATLLSVAAQQYILVLRLPTLCADNRTFAILINELAQLYQGDELDNDIVQYLQFSEWQNELIESDEEELKAGKSYWQKQASSASPRLPFEREYKLDSSRDSESISYCLPHELVEQMKAYATARKLPLSAVLLAAWNILLWRMTQQADFVTEILVEGRVHEELQSTFGLFDRYVPIKGNYAPSMTFNEVVTQLLQTIQEANEWLDFSILPNPEAVENERQPSIGFEFADFPTRYATNGVTFTLAKVQAFLKPFKLKLTCTMDEDGLLLDFHYDKEVYHLASLQYLPERLEMLLNSGISQPDDAIGKLNSIGEKEWQKLFDLRGIERPILDQECFPHRFEQQVRLTPDVVALVDENQQLTYAELNARANQLANWLKQRGIGPDVLVGITINRSIEIVVALLGVLKAGGSYVPIDPSSPQQRIQTLLEDIQSPVILTQESFKEKFQSTSLHVISIDSDWPTIAQESDENLGLAISQDQLAYVLYTSGSTGKPKGVCVEHRQLANYISSIIRQLELPDGYSYALISTFAADLGNTVIFPSLSTGGTLHILSHQLATSPDLLAEYFQQHTIDCLKIVPSHLKALFASSHPEHVLPRQRLVLGGEGTSWDLVETVQQLAPDCRIINHYGPTEATVGVLTNWIHADEPRFTSSTLPLCRVVDNTQIYVLDQELQPTPIGVPGELHIGGAALARGYLNQPDQTTEKFINDPFSEPSGNRLYKTGDLARYLPDGSLEILGRVDDQVKYHGFRIELDEIRQALNQYKQIQNSIVLIRKDQQQRDTLVAYYLADQELTTSDLRNHLEQRIPEEVIPNIFIHLSRIPLTANGKIDRQALPSIEEARQKSVRSFVAPHTPTEIALADIWSQVLGLDQIGIHDNFFALGGDSILGIQIIAKANQAGIQFSPKQLFQYQTIAELATVVNTRPPIHAEQGQVSGNIPLTPIQCWFFEQKLSDPQNWHITLIAESHEELDPSLAEQTIQFLLQQHDVLRLRLAQQGESIEATIVAGDDPVPFKYIDLAGYSVQEQDQETEQVINQLQATLNLATGPLFQSALINLGDDRPAKLLFVIHRLVIDGVSWRILIDQFATAYQELSNGQHAQLPAKTTSFKYWVEQLVNYAQTDKLQQELDYWLSKLRANAAILPVDHPKPEMALQLNSVATCSLTQEETSALLHEVPSAYQTEINDVLLAAVAETLASWIGTNKVLLDLEGHGREPLFDDVDLSSTVGWFTTLFPVLLEKEPDSTEGELLASIKEQLRAIPKHGIGYGLLRYLCLDQSVIEQFSGLTQAQIHFRYAGQFNIPVQSAFAAFDQREPNMPTRQYQLDINAAIVADRLEIGWWYSDQIYSSATVEELAQSFIAALRRLIQHCLSPEAGGYTPSDFPLLNADQQKLNKLLGKLRQS
jgi:amino acid adenylation domain-containing protein/non-ribosomal peptide synthase protein (TIGR01720 family)